MPMLLKPLHAISKLMGNKYERAGHLFDYPGGDQLRSHIFSQEQYYFKQQELKDLLVNTAFDFKWINDVPSIARKLSPAELQSVWDFDHYLKDDLLVKVDRASMQYSLESRVPLLDYRLVEFAYNLSPELKIKNGSMKYLLKQVLYDHVPQQIFERPKWGFTIPLKKWLKGDLKYLIDRYTSPSIIEQHNIVNATAVARLKEQYTNGKNYLYNRLWLIVVLHWWLEENKT